MIKNHIAKLRSEAAAQLEKANKLERLLIHFPDLERSENRWGKEKLCSAMVNSIATEYYSHHNCGCCADSPLEIEPYVKLEDLTIHSKPYSIMIGEKDRYGEDGDIIWSDWRERLRETNISEIIIEKIEGDFNNAT